MRLERRPMAQLRSGPVPPLQMIRVFLLLSLFCLVGCDIFDSSETVAGSVVDGETGASVASASIKIGYYDFGFCVPGIYCQNPAGTFVGYGTGSTNGDGTFLITYTPGWPDSRVDDVQVFVDPCPEAGPQDCPYYGAREPLPHNGSLEVRLERRS